MARISNPGIPRPPLAPDRLLYKITRMVVRTPRATRNSAARASRFGKNAGLGSLSVPEVVTSPPKAEPANDEPDDEAIRRMLEAAYT